MKSLEAQNDQVETKCEVDKLRKVEGILNQVDDFSECKVLL